MIGSMITGKFAQGKFALGNSALHCVLHDDFHIFFCISIQLIFIYRILKRQRYALVCRRMIGI